MTISSSEIKKNMTYNKIIYKYFWIENESMYYFDSIKILIIIFKRKNKYYWI